jgi:V8-like Glu-specific endopeptidase
MKNVMKVALLLSLVATAQAGSRNKVVYGSDNRQEVSSLTGERKEWARATAAMIAKKDIKRGFFLFNLLGITRLPLTNASTLQDFHNLCVGERYADQLSASNCTGFLIAKDVLVTAGHCVTSQEDCDENLWAFDYTQENMQRGKRPSFKAKDVYKCEKILSQEYTWYGKSDFAVIKLNRKVKNRKPLEVERTRTNIAVGEQIAVIGTPSGLPLKFADQAQIRSIETEYFITNLDTFGGNSGSPVISTESGKVIGILVRGENDYEVDPELGCYRPYKCKEDECRGEDVTFITELPAAEIIRSYTDRSKPSTDDDSEQNDDEVINIFGDVTIQ